MERKPRVGVVLFQLGGPDSLESVRPFLYNLFCDPDILDLPFGPVLRKPLAWWIARRRWHHAAHGYAAIGNRSPILPLTELQARALEAALAPHVDPRIVIAMRYWHPFTGEAVAKLRSERLDQIVLLPLYPQFSLTTTGSSLNEWNRQYPENGVPVRVVRDYFAHPLYVDSVVDSINTVLKRFAPPAAEVHLLFSAHSLPMSFIERGDPYQKQIEESVRLVMQRGSERSGANWPGAHSLCYQSRVGRQRWLEPTLVGTLQRLAAAGTPQVLVVPISFVTEHIETLHEINQEARELAAKLGIQTFRMMPAVGDSPRFIACLADLVLASISGSAACETSDQISSAAS